MTTDVKSNQSKTAAEQSVAEEGLVHDPGRRFPIFTSPKGYAGVSFLNEAEKAVGNDMLWARWETPDQTPEHYAEQVRNPSYVLQSDPLLWQHTMDFYARLTKLVYGESYDPATIQSMQDGSIHGKIQDPETLRRYQLGQLMIAKIAQELDIEWVMRLLGVSVWGFLSRQQLLMLNKPHSYVWSEEQSLALEFTAATINRTMRDDLFARAKEKWGTKQLLRYATWITYYVAWVMLSEIDVSDADRGGKGTSTRSDKEG